jgi:2-amino-4-hydroxy-6-hydroxymethyldihydropteridine diphosphokinase
MVRVFLGLGGNVGPVEETLTRSVEKLDLLRETRVVRLSSLYRTEPVGVLEQPPFLNAAAEVETLVSPLPFLRELLALESSFGRTRELRWGPRTLDLDLLLWGDEAILDEGLTLPHPRLHERGFVLEPLAEIAGPVRHPVLQRTIAELLAAIRPTAGVDKVSSVLWPGPGLWRQ